MAERTDTLGRTPGKRTPTMARFCSCMATPSPPGGEGWFTFKRQRTFPGMMNGNTSPCLPLEAMPFIAKDIKRPFQYIKQAIPMAQKPRDFYTAVSLLKTALNKEGTDPHELQHLIIRCYESAYVRSPNPKDLYNLCPACR